MEQVQARKLLPWILLTSLLTGTIDALSAIIINYKIPAPAIFKFIASGIFGTTAFSPGNEMVYYGILFHYCIAFAWTTIFFLFYTDFMSLVKFRFILILIIGLVIWVVMNLVVLPVSQTPPSHFHLVNVVENIAALILAFGLPVTIIADKFYYGTHVIREWT
jgi:hypothetical protein